MPPQTAGVLPFGEQSVDLPAGPRLVRAPPQSTSSEHLLRAPPLSWRWSVPRAPRYPKPPRTRSAGRRSGPGPTRSPPPRPRGPPPLPPHANPLTPQVLPRDEQGVVRRLAVRPAASPFFGEAVEGRDERGAGLVGGTWISAPWFWASLGELIDAVAPSVAPAIAGVLAARPGQRRRSNAARVMLPGQRRRGRPELEGEPLDLHQPLVLGLLDLGAEDIAVGSRDQSKTSDPQYFLSLPV